MKNLMKRMARLALCLVLAVVCSCDRMDTEFESFLDKGEITYPGVGTNFSYRAGHLRTALVWNPSADPSITHYVVYYNNKADSVTVDASSHDPSQEVEVVVPDLLEYIYSFTIYAVDAKGNRSIPQEVNNVKVYGDFYQGSLLNRPYDGITPYELYEDGKVELNFVNGDTIIVGTEIKYINNSDEEVKTTLGENESIATLNDYKMGTPVLYRSSYIPAREAIDEFQVTHYDTFPEIKPYVYTQIDKSIWRENPLANDVGTYEGQTSVSKLWDGSVGPQGYPNIFHSNTMDLPQVLTFDLGKRYLLGQIEETGRNCCHNPDKFQVWGIESLQGAATALPSQDPGWEAEAITRGWKLLGEINRTDDGAAPYKVELNHRPTLVQYIRIRIMHTANNNTNTSNMSEITFWSRDY